MKELRPQFLGFVSCLVLFLGQPACDRDDKTATFDAILSLYEEHDIVHIGERHWNMTDYNFRTSLVKYHPFAEIVDESVSESGNYLHQDMLDDYILRLEDVPNEELCYVWRDFVVPTGVWDATIYKEFIHTVREVNEKLPPEKRIRLIASEPPIDWSRVDTWEEMETYFCARSTHTPEVVEAEVLIKNRKALIIYGGAHFYRTSNVVPCAGRLRANLEARMEGKIFTILPLSGGDEFSHNFQQEAGVDEVPLFLRVRESKLASLPGDLFFWEAEGTLGDFTDGVLYFGLQPDAEAEYDPAAANDTAYQEELERRQAISESRPTVMRPRTAPDAPERTSTVCVPQACGGPGGGEVSEKQSDICGAPPVDASLGGYRILEPSGKAEVPFRMLNEHILIPVRVNGSEPFRLVLDTGMPWPGIVLHPSPRTDALDLTDPDGVQQSEAGEGVPSQRVGSGVTLGFPGVELTDQTVTIQSLPSCVGAEEGAPIIDSEVEGVIGTSIFGNFVVTIDHDRDVITLVEPERFSHVGWGHEIPFTMGPMNVPQVTCEVEQRPGQRVPLNVAVDTGATYALSLTLGTNDRIHLPEGARDWVRGYSAWGPVTGSLGRISALHIGDLELRDVLVTFFNAGDQGVPPCGENGILGNEALSRFNVTFDYARKRMILEPNRRSSEPFEIDMCGILYEKTEGGALRVRGVLPDSPASEAGLREGDVLTNVNGRPPADYSPDELSKLLRTEGAEVRIRFTRDREELSATLRLRRLV
jgi:hypothetical protein